MGAEAKALAKLYPKWKQLEVDQTGRLKVAEDERAKAQKRRMMIRLVNGICTAGNIETIRVVMGKT